MITTAAPAFLVAGGLLAAIPILLHLLSRRPPGRAPLPTARFLAEDSRTLLRLRRTPSDLPLLALRVLFALALGAAFAGLRWAPEREGTRQVILLDAGSDSLVEWDDVAEAVGELADRRPVNPDSPAPDSPRPDSPTEAEGEPPLVIVYGLDDGPTVVAVAEVQELTRGSAPATLEEGLRALRREAAASRFAQAEVTWVGRLSWQVWSPAIGLLRPALWPGRLGVLSVGSAGDGGSTGAAPSSAPESDRRPAPTARVGVAASRGPVERAVTALGGQLLDDAGAAPGSFPDWIVVETTSGEGLAQWRSAIQAGAALVAYGEPPSGSTDLPWVASLSEAPSPDPALLLLPGDRGMGSPVPRAAGHPTPGARTLLTFDDGTPAAAAQDVGEGCVVFVATDLTDAALTTSPEYPELLRTLFGCRESGFGDGPLDRGAVQALERPDLPATVAVAAILAAEGRSLTRWLLLAALGLLGLEVAMTSAERIPAGRRTREGPPS